MGQRIIAHRLKKLRRTHGLSQRIAAQLIGVTPTQLMRWEKGKRMPTGKNLFKLGALYQTLVEDIYYEIRKEAIEEITSNQSKTGTKQVDIIRVRPP